MGESFHTRAHLSSAHTLALVRMCTSGSRQQRFLPWLAADNQVELVRLGAVQSILEAMAAHSAHADVQQQACRALANLAMIGARLLRRG